MASAPATLTTVPAATARRLLLHGQGLLADPARRATPAAVRGEIERMGFVQVDTINVVDRAHHHILRSRFDGYEPSMLEKLLERDRSLFEHWTHDASVVPTRWFTWWRVRFERYRRRDHSHNAWWNARMGGEPDKIMADVLERIEREGPLMSRDFEPPPGSPRGAWWGWRPSKAALEHLWRAGRLSIVGRVNFHKVYELTERAFPDLHDGAVPDDDAHRDWACREALSRLGVATPSELAAFFDAVSLAQATAWCRAAVADGRAVPVQVEADVGAKPWRAVAHPDWRARAARAPEAPRRIRILSPFDPVLRDRRRALRLFGFDYRFEAFVPAPSRRYGYYVMPLLEGDRLVGRLDAKLHRGHEELEVKGLWWEPGVRLTRVRVRALSDALDLFAGSLGARHWTLDEA